MRSSKLSQYFEFLDHFDYASQALRIDKLHPEVHIPEEIVTLGNEPFCAKCDIPYTESCLKKGHLSPKTVARVRLTEKWRDRILEEMSKEMRRLGIEHTDSVFYDGEVRMGFTLILGEYYVRNLEHIYAQSVGANRCDVVLVCAKSKLDEVKRIENNFPELFFAQISDFSKNSKRLGIIEYVYALGRQNLKLRRHNASAANMKITPSKPFLDGPMSVREEIVSLVESIRLRRKSSMNIGNRLEVLVKRLCSGMFFQYSISDRQILPDMLFFQPGSLEFYVVDVKSGSFDISGQRQVIDYSSDQLVLSLIEKEAHIGGTIIIHWSGKRAPVDSYCTKTEEKLKRIEGISDSFRMIWLTVDGLIFLSQWVDKDINARFFLNYFMSSVFRSGYNGRRELVSSLGKLEGDIGILESDRDIIHRALQENRDRYHPSGRIVA